MAQNRLAELRGRMSQKEFADMIGLKQQNYWKYENGKQSLKSDLIEKICTTFGCTAEWLLGFDENGGASAAHIARDPFTDVPLYGSIAAGTPIEMIEVDEYHPVPTAVYEKYPNSFLLRVKGNSMDKVLPDGCYALIDPCQEVSFDNDPHAVCVNGFDATIKRVRALNNGFELVPDSTDPTYPVQTYNYNEPGTETITIIGRVVYYVLPFDWKF